MQLVEPKLGTIAASLAATVAVLQQVVQSTPLRQQSPTAGPPGPRLIVDAFLPPGVLLPCAPFFGWALGLRLCLKVRPSRPFVGSGLIVDASESRGSRIC